MIDPEILIELKNFLEKEHELLINDLSAIARPTLAKDDWQVKFPKFEREENYSHSQSEEEADEVEEYETRLAAGQSLESRLLEVKQGLERIHTKQYGLCRKCGKEISLERLKANPAAEYHVEHQ